ncbi:MAG: hypothetical protein J6I50_02295 [Clostridia bacterium]|nr:hypothetical protein [Clostridia bacterium]
MKKTSNSIRQEYGCEYRTAAVFCYLCEARRNPREKTKAHRFIAMLDTTAEACRTLLHFAAASLQHASFVL